MFCCAVVQISSQQLTQFRCSFYQGKGNENRLDRSACTDDSRFWISSADNPCGNYPIVLTGFCVPGLPEPAANNPLRFQGCGDEGINNGINPDGGVYRVDEDPPEGWDGANPEPCDQICSFHVGRGQGANFLDPDDEGKFTWSGGFTVFRPAGQTSYDPTFPDQEGGIWEVTGGTVFFEDGDDFTVRKYVGKKPFDVCAELEL